MSYQTLYRKYRPRTFDDVVGQEHITTTLKNQIKSGRVGHAYLFCGIRGTGKTTIAKIFAKAVNCPNNTDGNPCLDCDVCNEIAKDANINVIEIDAASNNGVDNIREIREEVRYMPTKGKYKVYIIDEVHMLSMSAFNALLKTLEEPPAHVIFILATTEVQKIPATILSRVQRFDFRRISVKSITNLLDIYMKKEGIDIDEKALSYIAKKGDGSARDSLSILDQIISFSQGEQITLKMVQEILGTVDNKTFANLINSIYETNAVKCIELVNEIYMNGKDIKQFVAQIIEYLRNLIIAASIHDSEEILDMSDENVEELKQIAQIIGYDNAVSYISEFSSLDAKIKYDNQPKITLELALLKMCQPKINEKPIEKLIVKEAVKEVPKEIEKIVVENKKEEPKIILNGPVSEEMKQAIKIWKDIKEACKDPLKSMLIDTEARYYSDKIYCIVCPTDMIKNYIDKNISVIKEKLDGILKKEYSIKAMTKEDYEREVKTGSQDFKESEIQNKDDNSMKQVEEFFSKFGVKVEKVD